MEKLFNKGEFKKFPDNVRETRTIPFTISSERRDRYNSIIPLDNWNLDNFNANGITGYQHNVYGGDLCNAPNPDDTLGPGKAWIEENRLMGSIQFEPKELNPLADKIFEKVLYGTLRSTSVGFTETTKGDFGNGDQKRGGENETYYYGQVDLLEFSVVNIPANPDAQVAHIRSNTYDALMFIKRSLGSDFSFSDIEKMQVSEVLTLLEQKKSFQSAGHSEKSEQKELEIMEENFNKNRIEILKIKTYSNV